MNVAVIYLHRFFLFHSFRRFPRNVSRVEFQKFWPKSQSNDCSGSEKFFATFSPMMWSLLDYSLFSLQDVAAACLFLAAKVEEMPRKLEYIVKISHALQHRDEPPLDLKSNVSCYCFS